MQATEPLLQELFLDILQQQQEQVVCQQELRGGDGVAGVELSAEAEAKIAKVCEQYERCVQDLVSVERHLLQAKARTLTEEEKRLSDRKQALCGYDKLIKLPLASESPLGSFLDRELLERNHLLHPDHYLSHSLSLRSQHLSALQELTPTYLQPTFTSTQHTSTSQPHSTSKLFTGGQSHKPPWKNRPTLAEREAERAALARLRQRGEYLVNPRYSSHPLPNTSSSGALRRRRRGPLTGTGTQEPESPTRKVQFFVAEPNQVFFTDYQVGHTYQIDLDIRNVSGCSRQMRVVPLSSPYFTVKRGDSSQREGLIAPGMHVTCTVTFTPTSLCNYQEEIKVQSHSGYCLTIPVLASRPAPCLSLPEVIDCGSCLAGSRREVVLEVKNSGGEGKFSIRHQDTSHQSGDVFVLGPFSLSPTEFHLQHNHSTTFKVTFLPDVEGKYGEHFAIECDNGETISFSLTGNADVVSVGCVSIGNSTSQEVSRLTPSDTNQGVDPVISAIDEELYTERLEDCSVVFDSVNPHSTAYKTVVIRNYSTVDLPFTWKLFRPLTELDSSNGENPVVDELVCSTNSPFSVLPTSGTFPAASSHTFICQFLPSKEGQFLDVAHLVLSGVPPASLDLSREGETWREVPGDSTDPTISCVCLFFSALALPYEMELQPPAVLLPAPIPLSTVIRRRVKLVSHSVSTLHYSWSGLLPKEGITITPTSGSIVGGGGAYCEVVIRRREEGEFKIHLICDIQHSPHPVTLPLHGWTLGPQVGVDCASLQFGLVPLGTSSQLTLTLTSHTNTSLSLLIRQTVNHTHTNTEQNILTDHECLHCTPSSLILPPHSVTTLTVECRPLVIGRLRSMLQCVADGRVIRCVPVHAEVQSPMLVLSQCRLHEDTAYVGVPLERTVHMTNASLIPTTFTWSKQVEGGSSSHCSVSISPLSGTIGPRETLPITLTATWDSVGSHPEAILHCDVEGMSESLLLVLSAEVHGLAVNYTVQEKCSSDEKELCLEFGSDNSLFSPHVLHLSVTNTTAIPAHLSTTVRSFPSSLISHPHQSPHTHSTQKKFLLSRTVNIGDPNSKTSQQANKDYVCGLLGGGRGCCFVVDPPSTPLLPFTTHTLTITAYADMWGDYSDTLVCQVSGLEAVEVPIHCQFTGCPLVFQSTAQPQHTLIRFGSHLANAPPVQRVIRINNTGPEEIRVDWQMFAVLEEDSDQVVDFITTIGTPLPRITPSHSPHTSPPSQRRPRMESKQGGMESGQGGMVSGQGGMEPGQGSGGVGEEVQCVLKSDPVVRVFLRGHEGVRADHPFTVHQTQMVVPARGQSSFKITFNPSLCDGSRDPVTAYCLGYISLDQQPVASVKRVTGYELAPLRVDLESRVEQPHLHLEQDQDHGLHFSYSASILLHCQQVLSSVSRSHQVTLVNLTSSSLSFTLSSSSSSSPHFTITPSPQDTHTLTPHRALSVTVVFHLCKDSLKGFTDEKLTFSDTLVVKFSTGATQEFPLSAELSVPHISLSTQDLELGPCLLGQSLSSSLTLSNSSTTDQLPWTTQPHSGLCDVVSVSPSSGVLSPHVGTAGTSSQQLLLTFTPQVECEYSGVVAVRELLTGLEAHIRMTASTTSDEVHATNFS